MTKTIHSATSDTFYFLTIENGSAVGCSCPDRQYRSYKPCCKHMSDFDAEVAKAERFLALKAAMDCRSDAVKAAKREAYCQEFSIY